MSKIALSGPAGGTATYTVTAPTGATDRTLTLPDASGTLLSTGSTFAGTGPAFRAYLGANQSVTSATDNKIQLSVEVFDTASCFNPTGSTVGGIPAYAYKPNVAGYYQFTGNLYVLGTALVYNFIQIFKNGVQDSATIYGPFSGVSSIGSVSALIYMNGSTDYVELYAQANGTAPLNYIGTSSYCFFSGALVRAA